MYNCRTVYQRQVHLTLKFHIPPTGNKCQQHVKINFILCASEFILHPDKWENEISTNKPFIDLDGMYRIWNILISELPSVNSSVNFFIIGILGPTYAYTSTGIDMKRLLRKFAKGAPNERRTGYALLYSMLERHSTLWKEHQKVHYCIRQTLTVRLYLQNANPNQFQIPHHRVLQTIFTHFHVKRPRQSMLPQNPESRNLSWTPKPRTPLVQLCRKINLNRYWTLSRLTLVLCLWTMRLSCKNRLPDVLRSLTQILLLFTIRLSRKNQPLKVSWSLNQMLI